MARKPHTFDETRDRYLRTIALSLRPNTVTQARIQLNCFIRYLRSEHPCVASFAQLKRSHIQSWLTYVGNQPVRRMTKRSKIVVVRAFIRRIQDWGWQDSPQVELFRGGDVAPMDRYLPRPLSEETDLRLLNELRKRDHFITKGLLLLRSTGLRIQELLDLKIHSLRKLPGGTGDLHVPLGKLHSERVIPVTAETVELFDELCKHRGSPPPAIDPETGKPDHFLFMRPDGRRIIQDNFRYFLAKIEKQLHLKEHPTAHRLRHTFATAMLRAGMRLPALMKILGHRNIGMTLRYAEVTGLDVQREYARAMQALEDRYEIPAFSGNPGKSVATRNRQTILDQLRTVAATMEAYRRDHAKPSQKKKIRRFVERLRRLTADFEGFAS